MLTPVRAKNTFEKKFQKLQMMVPPPPPPEGVGVGGSTGPLSPGSTSGTSLPASSAPISIWFQLEAHGANPMVF